MTVETPHHFIEMETDRGRGFEIETLTPQSVIMRPLIVTEDFAGFQRLGPSFSIKTIEKAIEKGWEYINQH